MTHAFVKMNGLGNDFVIVQDEAGRSSFRPTAAAARAIADRASGIGCDQLIVLEPSAGGDARLRIWNADGGEVGACGNAARCVAWLIMEAAGRDEARLETAAGILTARRSGPMGVEIDFGPPGLGWRDIPLAEPMDTRGIELQVGPIDAPAMHTPGCVSMGNPHVVFFVADAETAPVTEVGPMIENHPMFPERTNVGFAQIVSPQAIRLRVWERGAGLTRACGTGACAALVAAHRRGLAERAATLRLDGGELFVRWRDGDDHVLMTGAVAFEFAGRLPLEAAA